MNAKSRQIPDIREYINQKVLHHCKEDFEVLRFELMRGGEFIKEVNFIHFYNEGKRTINVMVQTNNCIVEILSLMEDLTDPNVSLKFIESKKLVAI